MIDERHQKLPDWRTAAGPTVAAFVDAVNSCNGPTLIELFDDEALVNDQLRDFWGKKAIAQWLKREIVAQHFTMDVRSAHTHFGDVILTARVTGDFDSTGLPESMIHNFHFTLKEGRIVRLLVLLAVGDDTTPQVRVTPR
jgi:ketosteroid isomerase-like protein